MYPLYISNITVFIMNPPLFQSQHLRLLPPTVPLKIILALRYFTTNNSSASLEIIFPYKEHIVKFSFLFYPLFISAFHHLDNTWTPWQIHFKLTGSAPNYTDISLSAVYKCNKESLNLFEIESIDVSSQGIVVGTDRRDTQEKHQAHVSKATLVN